MPLLPRSRGASNDAESGMRRHSFHPHESALRPPSTPNGRKSESITRNPFHGDLLLPGPPGRTATAADASARRPSLGQRSTSPPVQDESFKHRRFSMLRFRHASEGSLASKARQQAQPSSSQVQTAQSSDIPPVPQPPPEIIRTAPTVDMPLVQPSRKKSRAWLPGLMKPAADVSEKKEPPLPAAKTKERERRRTMVDGNGSSGSRSRVTFDEPDRPVTHGAGSYPPAYGEDANTALALPVTRLSESSRSDGSSGDHGVYAQTTTTTHTVSTTTTFFRMARRKKPAPLFDLQHLPQKHSDSSQLAPPGSAGGSRSSPGFDATAAAERPMTSPTDKVTASRSAGSPLNPASSASQAGVLLRQGSSASAGSSPVRQRSGLRNRSSTLNSLVNVPTQETLPTPTLPPSTRTSSSTGRKSFGDLFGLSSRLRQNSDVQAGGLTPGSTLSLKNAALIARHEKVVLPERQEDDTPAKYLLRLEEVVSRGVVASVLSKGTDTFSQGVLRSYMRGFGFFGDPMDMAIRKLLMEVELPKETQQIDRCLQGFANRYHECNPGIYASPDQAYFIAFSLLILHTDVFNKNNKHKMQKSDYIKNTRGEGIFPEILECFYDNISYTPFIHVEDDLDINGERIIQHKVKRKPTLFPRTSMDPLKNSREPVDPYTLIIDSKIDTLRPNLKDVMNLEEHYNYLGTASSLNLRDLQKTFFRTGVLQIVSARSRPDAFLSEKTVTNPEQADVGVVDIKVTKVGLLWRKDAKKKKTRSPWQEWGAILTGAQLYFFKNTAWIKSLMHQNEQHIKQGHDGTPVIFTPPLDHFKPDALISTDDSVALLDSMYKKHKNAFVFVRHGGFEETFLADNEGEMNDWLAKLNYAAAFRTSGVRMRGLIGSNYEGQRTRGIRRLESNNDFARSVQTPTGEVTIVSGKIDTKMAQDILSARREIMLEKIRVSEERLAEAQAALDTKLRNARHLQILTPIQPKTREQILLAAARMAAQLKWSRVEIWRLKCHKDILKMDLDDEGCHAPELLNPKSEPASTGRDKLARLNSKSSTVTPQYQPKSPVMRPATQPSASAADEPFFTPPPSSSSAIDNQTRASWELPPLDFDRAHTSLSNHKTRPSSLSSLLSSSPVLASNPSRAISQPMNLPSASNRPPSPHMDDAEQSVLNQLGLVQTEGSSETKPSGSPEKEDVADKEKGSNIRRSLHRTLREAHVPTHLRSRKGKDSSSSAGMSDDTTDDVLARGTGSFTVHGKKASVITFGTELQSMSPEERLRLRRQPHKYDPDPLSRATIGQDFNSIIAEPYEFRERRGSAATASTATARSFRDLHHRLSSSHGNGSGSLSVAMDHDDYESALSFSDGRRTPLPPVKDGNEDDYMTASGQRISQEAISRASTESSADEKYSNAVEHHEEDAVSTPDSPLHRVASE